MKLAVIGVGKMGMLHAGIMNGLEDVELCSVSDNSKFLLGAVKSLKKDVTTYDDYRSMLNNEEIDIAVIATPVFLHIPMAIECTKRNIHFFLEKPLCIKSDEANSLIDEINSRSITTMVGYMMRYVDTFMKAKEIIDSGALGKLITFNGATYVSQLFRTGKGWRYSKKESGGGVVIGQSSHLIDLIKWYFGPVDLVSAHTINWYSKEVEDFAHVNLEYENGLKGWFDSSWSIKHHRLLQITLEIHAENGNLFVSDDYVKLYLDSSSNGFNTGWTNFTNPDLFKGVEIDLGGPQYTRQDADFINAVKKNQKVESDIGNAYYVQKIVDRIYDSASNHGEPLKL